MKAVNCVKKSGFTLIISSIFLMGILFLTMASMRSSLYQRSIITTMQTDQQMKLAAEAAVRQAEKEVFNTLPTSTKFSDACVAGLCKTTSIINSTGIWNSTTLWNNAKSITNEFNPKIKFITTPKYLIEYMGERDDTQSMSQGQTYQDREDYSSSPVYRVTGKVKDQKGKRETVIQSTIY